MNSDATAKLPEYRKILELSFRERYDKGRDYWSNEESLSGGLRLLLEHLDAGQRREILDIGAGQGRDAERLLLAGHSVTGVDLYPHPAWPALAARWPGRARFEGAYFQEWAASRRESFDAVLDSGCFHHQHPDEYLRYLGLIYSLLRPGGVAAFCVYTPEAEAAATGRCEVLDIARLARYFTAGEFRDLIEESGLRWLRSRRVHRSRCGQYYLAVLAVREKSHAY